MPGGHLLCADRNGVNSASLLASSEHAREVAEHLVDVRLAMTEAERRPNGAVALVNKDS